MAKKIVMIAPFDVLTGNLSGQQRLKYAENNNPAYEAPNGSQGARNYKTRYVGARRADGTTYFSVRQKNTAILSNKTRMAMGLTGVTQACWAAITPADRAQVAAIVASLRALDPENPELASTAKCWNARCRRMLQYKQSQFIISGPAGSFTFKNPFNMDDSNAHAIATRIWLKFADLFVYDNSAAGGVYYAIDGKMFFAFNDSSGVAPSFDVLVNSTTNPNYAATITDLSLVDDKLKYTGAQVYTSAGVEVSEAAKPTAGQKYTTIAPQS